MIDILAYNDIVKNVCVYGLDESVKASKYPMAVDTDQCTNEITDRTRSLAACEKGSGHDQFLTGIIVQFDLTLSIKAWTEAERYHFLDFISSQSTMHKLNKFKIADQCNAYVDQRVIDVLQELVDEYNDLLERQKNGENVSIETIKTARLKMLYNTPSGFELTAGMTTNYQQLKTIYQQRRHHALPDWQMFCDWIETLPRFMELTQKENNNA